MDGDLQSLHLHIIGLGLMGGSLAMDLRGQVRRITGQDRDPEVIEAALAQAVIDGESTPAQADIVVLATPTHTIIDLLPTLELRGGTLVIDLGSTKQQVCAQMDRLADGVMAVGGHPMCGVAENGFRQAQPGLFENAAFVLCETARTTKRARVLAESLVNALDANSVWMDAALHDERAAVISHVPHLLNIALMQLAMTVKRDDEGLYVLVGGGFEGATRLARTDAAMIIGMLLTNRDNVRHFTGRLREHLDQLEQMLDDPVILAESLDKVIQARRSLQERIDT